MYMVVTVFFLQLWYFKTIELNKLFPFNSFNKPVAILALRAIFVDTLWHVFLKCSWMLWNWWLPNICMITWLKKKRNRVAILPQVYNSMLCCFESASSKLCQHVTNIDNQSSRAGLDSKPGAIFTKYFKTSIMESFQKGQNCRVTVNSTHYNFTILNGNGRSFTYSIGWEDRMNVAMMAYQDFFEGEGGKGVADFSIQITLLFKNSRKTVKCKTFSYGFQGCRRRGTLGFAVLQFWPFFASVFRSYRFWSSVLQFSTALQFVVVSLYHRQFTVCTCCSQFFGSIITHTLHAALAVSVFNNFGLVRFCIFWRILLQFCDLCYPPMPPSRSNFS